LPLNEQQIRESNIVLIDHILNSLCFCELNKKGRKYLEKIKDDLKLVK
jgi:hypothetical protein